LLTDWHLLCKIIMASVPDLKPPSVGARIRIRMLWEKTKSQVPGLLDKKGGKRFHLLLSKRWHLLPPFMSNEPGNSDLCQ
jgi:hypothetical protein